MSVLYEIRGKVAVITINRPGKHNSVDPIVVDQLNAAWVRFEQSDERVAVLTGMGNSAFSAGADVSNVPPDIWRAIPGIGLEVSKPVISAVGGWCIGAGFVLVQMSDICVAADNAQFSYPEAKIGFTGGAIASLVARIPHKVAMELMLLGNTISAKRAYEVGFVNEVVPVGQQLERAIELAEELAENAPLALALLKSFSNQVIPKGPSELAAQAASRISVVMNSKDKDEGLASFKEKRKPEFSGR